MYTNECHVSGSEIPAVDHQVGHASKRQHVVSRLGELLLSGRRPSVKKRPESRFSLWVGRCLKEYA